MYDLMVTRRSRTRATAEMNYLQRAAYVRGIPYNLNPIASPGLSAMKANEMQNKIMPLVPSEFKYYYKRMTTALQLAYDKAKEEKKKKQQAKAAIAALSDFGPGWDGGGGMAN